MNREHFEELVAKAVEQLPEEFKQRMENVDVVVEDLPSSSQTRRGGTRKGTILLGLYEGIPLTHRGSYYGMVTPDKISVFQKSIESICRNDEEILIEIGKVVRHEIAHHFGISDARLRELENQE